MAAISLALSLTGFAVLAVAVAADTAVNQLLLERSDMPLFKEAPSEPNPQAEIDRAVPAGHKDAEIRTADCRRQWAAGVSVIKEVCSVHFRLEVRAVLLRRQFPLLEDVEVRVPGSGSREQTPRGSAVTS